VFVFLYYLYLLIHLALHKYICPKWDLDNFHFTKSNSYAPLVVYGQSKTCNIMFTKSLNRKLKNAGIEDILVACCHPGVIATELMREMVGLNFD
jgi:NAD(P)-dependent dehydrogenase (short-subunit alcohol dehydrogenase family)